MTESIIFCNVLWKNERHLWVEEKGGKALGEIGGGEAVGPGQLHPKTIGKVNISFVF